MKLALQVEGFYLRVMDAGSPCWRFLRLKEAMTSGPVKGGDRWWTSCQGEWCWGGKTSCNSKRRFQFRIGGSWIYYDMGLNFRNFIDKKRWWYTVYASLYILILTWNLPGLQEMTEGPRKKAQRFQIWCQAPWSYIFVCSAWMTEFRCVL